MSEQKKNKIVLIHTSRIGEDYLKSLDFRFNGKYDKKPHYVILKTGEVINLLEDTIVSNFFLNQNINEQSIVISLENLGWLSKNTLSKYYSNWIGNKVEAVKEKKWRAKYFWDFYTQEQTESLVQLCNDICERNNIPKKFIGNNTRISGSENYNGIVTRSNFDEDYTDLSPAFNFVYLLEKFNYDESI
jgi:N-acetyl-anhydromuramyl-L-alanine amidase AmpD